MRMIKNWLHIKRLRNQLIEVFGKAGLYTEHQTRGGKFPIYPKIYNISSSAESVRYVFTIPNGLDPQKIEKKWFCFQQILGRNITIEGDVKKFVLHVFHSNAGLNPYNYCYREWQPQIKGYDLPVVVGRDQYGKIIAYDMIGSNSPHLLIAGETGSGKSSMVRVVLTTLIQYMSPNTLHLYLGDLKNSEFHFLRKVKHVKEVCMEEIEMKIMLQKLWKEIRERRKLMEEYEVDHINAYNKLNPNHQKPYILLAIDEVAMLKDEKECMTTIEKISAVGRSLGVFLLLSMQRPDAKVLDGKLKLNMTVRMGFKCDSAINSNIIGTPGSEYLEQSGQMIFKRNGLKKVQAPYLELIKAKQIVELYRMSKEEKILKNSLQEEIPLFGVLDDEE
ncbi:TPA: DNA translocase FtsK [Bacillus cereus]|nr:DNA translocase FtsK [Bacillus cereus]